MGFGFYFAYAGALGLEPKTYGLKDQHSNQIELYTSRNDGI